MNNLLVVFNGNHIYPSNINKLNARRLYIIPMDDYIKELQTQIGTVSGHIEGQIAPISEAYFYPLQLSNIIPLFPVNVLKSLYRELFQRDYKSTYADFKKHSGFKYTSNFIDEYLKPIYIYNKLVKDYEKVHNYFKILEGGITKEETGTDQHQRTEKMANEHISVGITDRRERDRIINSIGISDSGFQGDIETEIRIKNFERVFRGLSEFI